jgi:hypothetical protein
MIDHKPNKMNSKSTSNTSQKVLRTSNKYILAITLVMFLFTTGAFAQNIPSYLPSNGLVGWWPFNGNANDESGNNYDGTTMNVVLSEDRFGNLNEAYTFDGASSAITISNNSGLDLIANFSIGCWFRSFSNVEPGNVLMIVNKHSAGQDNSGYTFGLWNPITVAGGILNCQGPPHFDYETYPNEPQAVIQDTNWHQGLVSYNDDLNLLTYFLDGAPVDTINISLEIDNNNHFLMFGAGSFGGTTPNTNFFNGFLDDIGIWNRALSLEEITAIYTGEPLIPTNIQQPHGVNTNTIKVFPNPAGSTLTIDYGNFDLTNGYQLLIENSLGQVVFQTDIAQQSDTLSLGTWGVNGLYFVHILDSIGNTIDIRKIVLQ